MNERDSETIRGLLESRGLELSPDVMTADVVLVNTCAVRQSAEDKVWSRLGKIASVRRDGKMPIMILAGCMAQLPETLDRVRKRVPYVHALVGPGQIDKIPDLVESYLSGQGERPSCAVSPQRTGSGRKEAGQMLPEELPRSLVPGLSAYVNIMYGCDNFCTYCIVPFVRGPQVSRKASDVKREVSDLVKDGYKEIVLLGQNVNAYGLDLDGDYSFADLLCDLDKVPDLLRLRYYTSHPRDFTRDMVDAVAGSSTVCEHFHLPLQSGSDRILKAMNRGYTRGEYLDLVGYIKEKIPGASITTDIITGFPGETEKDFQDTLDVVKTVRFDGAFTFIYSPRKGTSAARRKDQIPRTEKTKRLQQLVSVQNDITLEKNKELVGCVLNVLLEEKTEEGFKGRTTTNKVAFVRGDNMSAGDAVGVLVEEAGTWYLKGRGLR